LIVIASAHNTHGACGDGDHETANATQSFTSARGLFQQAFYMFCASAAAGAGAARIEVMPAVGLRARSARYIMTLRAH